MNFESAEEVDQICWNLKYSSWVRGQKRARINALFNGSPPYTAEEVQQNGIVVNVNDLSSTRLAHDARSQFYSAFCKPGNYFKASTDWGPVHKKDIWSTIVTREVNRPMKRSLEYFEKHRATFASDVLHGIGPSAWRDRDHWCPDPVSIEDALLPGETLLTMRDLPFFAIHKTLTGPALKKLTRNAPDKSKRYQGWNMDLVNACIEWIDQETQQYMGSVYPLVWSPERLQERLKGSGTAYAGDQAAAIEVFDFYFWNDDEKVEGWNRRMIIDNWATPIGPTMGAMVRKPGDLFNRNKTTFLFDSKTRKYARKREELITFQFADLSSVAPFRIDCVRSLGYMIFALCQIQNRLRCKFMECVFENMTMLFRVKSQEESQRALKVNLVNRGFIDESLEFIPAADRFQINSALVQLGLGENQRLIEQNSSSYTQNRSAMEDRKEKTATQVMAEVNAMASLVSAALLQAYKYAEEEDREIFRRFCNKDSIDPDVRQFQANCMKQGVPLSKLVPEAWDIEHDKVMGAGNKTLEMAITQQLMEWYDKLDPEPQRAVLRKGILAVTDDAAFSLDLVPESPVKITDSIHDAQMSVGALMVGAPVAVKTGMNHVEYIEALIASLAVLVQKANQPGTLTPKYIEGLNSIVQHIGEHIALIAKDESMAEKVRNFQKQVAGIVAVIQQMAAQLQKQQAQSNGHGIDPKDLQKIQGMQLQAQAKAANTRESHAARTVQRQLQWEQEMQRKKAEASLDLQRKAAESTIDIAREHLKTRMKSTKPKSDAGGMD